MTAVSVIYRAVLATCALNWIYRMGHRGGWLKHRGRKGCRDGVPCLTDWRMGLGVNDPSIHNSNFMG